MIKRLFSFRGLLSRGELLLQLLVLAATVFCTGMLVGLVRDVSGLTADGTKDLMALTNFAAVVLGAGIAVRRFRDIGANPGGRTKAAFVTCSARCAWWPTPAARARRRPCASRRYSTRRWRFRRLSSPRRWGVRWLVPVAAMLAAGTAAALPITDIVPGVVYYRAGFLTDPKVRAISVNYATGMVSVVVLSTEVADLVPASDLLPLSESIDRDLTRAEFALQALDVIATVLASSETPAPEPTFAEPFAQAWTPGAAHPAIANVVAGQGFDTWTPLPGYKWINPGQSLEVVWTPGLVDPNNVYRLSGTDANDWWSPQRFFMAQQAKSEQAREATLPPGVRAGAPAVTGPLLPPGSYQFSCELGEPFRASIRHESPFDHAAISHSEYHHDEHWLVVVLANGERRDAGIVGWQCRAQFSHAGTLDVAQIRGDAVLRLTTVPLHKFRTSSVVTLQQLLQEPAVESAGLRLSAYTATPMADGTYWYGLQIQEVAPSSPAALAGLVPGDLLMSADQHHITDEGWLSTYLATPSVTPARIWFARERSPYYVDLSLPPK